MAPYNKDFTRRKSNVLFDLDCRTTGAVRLTSQEGPPYFAVFTSNEAIEPGGCISMVRVPRGFTVTDVKLTWTANANAIIGVGDPYCCGRFLGPILTSQASGTNNITLPQGTTCAYLGILAKSASRGDGCGAGYTYTCETDIIITNGYGTDTFQQGGGSAAGGTATGGGTSAVLASGTRFTLKVDGYGNPDFTSPS